MIWCHHILYYCKASLSTMDSKSLCGFSLYSNLLPDNLNVCLKEELSGFSCSYLPTVLVCFHSTPSVPNSHFKTVMRGRYAQTVRDHPLLARFVSLPAPILFLLSFFPKPKSCLRGTDSFIRIINY